MTLDLNMLAAALAEEPRIVLATIFGSASNGTVRPGSDVDIAVLLDPALDPAEFYTFYVQMAARLDLPGELDLVDLNHANSILAFEALSGQRLVERDPEAVAAYSSEVARQYEDDMLHAMAHQP